MVFLFALGCISCKKYSSFNKTVPDLQDQNSVSGSRKVQFLLSTDNTSMSGDQSIIHFKVSITNADQKVLWDSAFQPMLIKDIPSRNSPISVEKMVPGNDRSLLKVGFYYSIENVGISWYLDSFKVGSYFKTVDFNFQ